MEDFEIKEATLAKRNLRKRRQLSRDWRWNDIRRKEDRR